MPDRPRGSTFSIRFLTRYDYDAEVGDNLNALRVRPAANSSQQVEEFSIRVNPEARQMRHDDYFGTEVVEFEVARPHRELFIDVRARVATQVPAAPPAATWESVRVPEYRESGGEFLLQTDDAPGHPVLESLISATSGREDPVALLMAVAEAIPDRFEYRKGATYVDSPLSAVLDGGAGVCQDFVHLGLCLFRHHGIAARYVSGYLFTTSGGAVPADGSVSPTSTQTFTVQSVEVDTHAWIEVLLPDPDEDGEAAWIGVDPTNRGLTTADHVKIGHGRHYADVPPIKGVYRGMANSVLEASVTMTRLGRSDPATSARI
jgi:transglutaminase-like putative cysteine protease